MFADIEQERAERRSKVEDEWIKPKQLLAEKTVQVAAVQVRACDSAESKNAEERNSEIHTVLEDTEPTAHLKSNAPSFLLHPAFLATRTPKETVILD